MMRIPPLRGRLARGMAAVLALCAVADVVALRDALRAQRVDVTAGVGSAAPVPRLPAFRRDRAAQADDTAPDDPFDPDRGAVVAQAGDPIPVTDAAAAAAAVSLIGTVVRAGGGSVAVCRLGSDAPRVLRIGEHIGGLTLLEVEQGRAAFRDSSGARVALRLATPGA